MDRAIVGHRTANEAVVLRGGKLARYRHDGSGVALVWEVDCRGKMIDCDAACTVVDAIVRTEQECALASWWWESGEPIFCHRIPNFDEPWALATSPGGEWAAIASLEEQCWIVHRDSGRLGARSDVGSDGCHTLAFSADGRRIGYGVGANGGTGSGYVLTASPEHEVLPIVTRHDFSPYDSYYSVLLDRDGSQAVLYVGYGSETAAVGDLSLCDVASGQIRWRLMLDLDVLGVEKGQHEGLPELLLTEDSLWFGTWGKVVVFELRSGIVRGDVELGIDGCAAQIALAAGGEWLWYLHGERVGVVRVADAMVTRRAPPVPQAARHPELERRVREQRDGEALRAYAAWLIEQGDDRGKLIELANGFVPPDPERAHALEQRFLNELSPSSRCRAYRIEGYFERGLLGALKATQNDPYYHRAPAELAFLGAREHLLFLETLFLEADCRDPGVLFSALRDSLMGSSLRHLVLQRRAAPDYRQAAWAELYPSFPGLRYLDVCGRVHSLGPVEQLRLEGLSLRQIVLEPSVLASVIGAPWPLRHLHLEFFYGPAASQLSPEQFQPLFDGALPLLEDLTISVTDEAFNAALIELALKAPLLDRLQSFGIDFSYVPETQRQRLIDRGVRLLHAPHTPSFLDRIHLPDSDPLRRLVPREHVRELFEAVPATKG